MINCDHCRADISKEEHYFCLECHGQYCNFDMDNHDRETGHKVFFEYQSSNLGWSFVEEYNTEEGE